MSKLPAAMWRHLMTKNTVTVAPATSHDVIFCIFKDHSHPWISDACMVLHLQKGCTSITLCTCNRNYTMCQTDWLDALWRWHNLLPGLCLN